MYAFQNVNKDLPDRIIMYRDGVGEGQLNFVFETEMRQITVRHAEYYDISNSKLTSNFTSIYSKPCSKYILPLGNHCPSFRSL